jgi:hypothetical protein
MLCCHCFCDVWRMQLPELFSAIREEHQLAAPRAPPTAPMAPPVQSAEQQRSRALALVQDTIAGVLGQQVGSPLGLYLGHTAIITNYPLAEATLTRHLHATAKHYCFCLAAPLLVTQRLHIKRIAWSS